jgi:hypothetical protein
MLEKIKKVGQILGDVMSGKDLGIVENLCNALPRNLVTAKVIRADGTLVSMHGFNTRENAGALWQAQVMGSAAGTPANYMALSANVLTTATGDTTLSGEITSGTNSGLARAQGTYQGYNAPTSQGGTANYQITHTFTSAASTTVNSAAMFNASSGGSLFVEANLSPAATLATGDQLVLTWTVNI